MCHFFFKCCCCSFNSHMNMHTCISTVTRSRFRHLIRKCDEQHTKISIDIYLIGSVSLDPICFQQQQINLLIRSRLRFEQAIRTRSSYLSTSIVSINKNNNNNMCHIRINRILLFFFFYPLVLSPFSRYAGSESEQIYYYYFANACMCV